LDQESVQFEKTGDNLPNSTTVSSRERRPVAPLNPLVGQSRVRPLVRVLIFLAVVFELGPAIIYELAQLIFGSFRVIDSPGILLFMEAGNFAILFGVTAGMALLEHRPIGDYGLPSQGILGKNFWLGALLGIAEISALIGLIAAFGGYSFGNLALQGGDMLKWCAVHLVLFLVVGLYEEFLFRGYAQFTLGQAIGFWPAAVLLSVGFGYVHLNNGGENWIGAANVAIIGLLFAFTLRRSGNLWYAIGLHASFDWGETFLYSVPNSGVVLHGHLSSALLHGPRWLTGGSVGPEGSVFSFLTMGLQFLVVMLLFPNKGKQGAGEITALDH
jgi:membrane protease YdiL (CAAX protease family)